MVPCQLWLLQMRRDARRGNNNCSFTGIWSGLTHKCTKQNPGPFLSEMQGLIIINLSLHKWINGALSGFVWGQRGKWKMETCWLKLPEGLRGRQRLEERSLIKRHHMIYWLKECERPVSDRLDTNGSQTKQILNLTWQEKCIIQTVRDGSNVYR